MRTSMQLNKLVKFLSPISDGGWFGLNVLTPFKILRSQINLVEFYYEGEIIASDRK